MDNGCNLHIQTEFFNPSLRAKFKLIRVGCLLGQKRFARHARENIDYLNELSWGCIIAHKFIAFNGYS
jgi:hypothetical protein